MDIVQTLGELRNTGGEKLTRGLGDAVISQFEADPLLRDAVDGAVAAGECWRYAYPELFGSDESAQIEAIQAGLVCFYPADTVVPYVALAARGPWIVTSKGAVLYEVGGYGMLGFGHAPQDVLDSMAARQVMANVMTSSFSHFALVQALKQEIGHARATACPYERFMFMNSGSEAVTVGARLVDINAKTMTDPGGRHAGKPIRAMSLRRSFHGRTDRPGLYSNSTEKGYRAHLASYRDQPPLLTVEPNDIEGLRAIFAQAERDGEFIEAMFMEPVMGEGNPGLAITPAFYAAARELTAAHGSLLLVDSIQAGLRATGCLSMVDYPGFEALPAPDLETFSKAISAGQYPLSALALSPRALESFRVGVYGNTMTSNPRGMDVAITVLKKLTPELRANIRRRGDQFIRKFRELQDELGGGLITSIQGTGLLFSVELDPSFRVQGAGSIEDYMRANGINVIHGGRNSLRYTPRFEVTAAEVDLVVNATREALLNGPREQAQEAVSV